MGFRGVSRIFIIGFQETTGIYLKLAADNINFTDLYAEVGDMYTYLSVPQIGVQRTLSVFILGRSGVMPPEENF